MKTIRVSVDKKGHIRLDFIGYDGLECFEESDKLKKSLEGFGLVLNEGRIILMKGRSDIADKPEKLTSDDKRGIKA